VVQWPRPTGEATHIWIVVGPVMAFVIPSEVGKMYKKDGQQPPVTGWTGLWLFPFGIFIIPAIVWFVKVQGALNRYWESKAPRRQRRRYRRKPEHLARCRS
jgi:hypothetical protein